MAIERRQRPALQSNHVEKRRPEGPTIMETSTEKLCID
jgi:hypothetical protein